MPSPAFTPGEGGGKPAKPESENVWEFPWLFPQPPPEQEQTAPEQEQTAPEQEPFLTIPPGLNVHSSATEREEPTPSESPHDFADPPVPTTPVQQAQSQSPRKKTKDVFVYGTTGLLADTRRPDYVVTKENLGNIGELRGEAGPLRLPSNLIEMEAYLAARHNPLLHEVLIFTQHEGIPPGFRENVDNILNLFGESNIDESDRKEAKAYLTYLMNRHINDYRRPHRLNTSWEAAHGAYDPSVDGAETWDLLRVRMVQVGLEMAAAALGDMARRNGLDWDDATAFRQIIGDIELRLSGKRHSEDALADVNGRRITFYYSKDNNRIVYPIPNLFLHELGHIFNGNIGFGEKDSANSINMTEGHPNTWEGMGSP